jgi:hypothetical protein
MRSRADSRSVHRQLALAEALALEPRQEAARRLLAELSDH